MSLILVYISHSFDFSILLMYRIKSCILYRLLHNKHPKPQHSGCKSQSIIYDNAVSQLCGSCTDPPWAHSAAGFAWQVSCGWSSLGLLGPEQARPLHVVFHLQGGQTRLQHIVTATLHTDKLQYKQNHHTCIYLPGQSPRVTAEGMDTRTCDSLQASSVTDDHSGSLIELSLILLPIRLTLESCYSLTKLLSYLLHVLSFKS